VPGLLEAHPERRSAAVPVLRHRLGDIYLKHTLPGVLELFGSAVVWMIFILAILVGDAGTVLIAAALVAAVNGIDYFVTKAMARKGIIAK